jgi:hypothetical protein
VEKLLRRGLKLVKKWNMEITDDSLLKKVMFGKYRIEKGVRSVLPFC